MILVLTYHKVLRDPRGDPDLYTTSSDTFARHLDLLAQSGIRPLSPPELLQSPRDRKEPAYVLTFDDGTQDHFDNVLPLLEQHQHQAIFFVPTCKLGRDGYLSTDTLAELSRRGQVIGLHGHEHRRMDELGEEDIRVQMQLSIEQIERVAGQQPRTFAPPGGFMNARVRRAALDSGVQVIRTMRWGYNKHPDLTALACVPANRYMTERQFRNVLEFRSRAVTYALKQAAKRVLPMSIYASVRDALMGWLRGK
jgi:peptidoglycan/xylan/chitin deacetylase (PgdA/CDA1 family)